MKVIPFILFLGLGRLEYIGKRGAPGEVGFLVYVSVSSIVRS